MQTAVMYRYFLLCIPVSVVAYRFFLPQKQRGLFLLALSILFAFLASGLYAVYFLAGATLIYICAVLMGRLPAQAQKPILVFSLTWLICGLCFFKLFSGPAVSRGIVFPIGISYLTFRLIHYIVESYKRGSARGNFGDFALYAFFFPTFLSGPVERFDKFHPQAQSAKNIGISDFNYGIWRVICGVIKKAVIADTLSILIAPIFSAPGLYNRYSVIIAVYGLAWQIYMDFSGYTDIAIGVARVFGYRVAENFNAPFFKTNIALFWRNWHISVYSWIRDYFFFPLFGWRASGANVYLGIFCTMIVFMLWHQVSIWFLVLGIYHGALLAAWQLFQEIKKKKPLIRDFFAHRWLEPASAFLTFNFVSLGFIFFVSDTYNTKDILSRIFL